MQKRKEVNENDDETTRQAMAPRDSRPSDRDSRRRRWGWVLGLVEAELAAVGHFDRCDESPAFVADWTGEFDSFALELGDRRVDVVAHEVELVMAGVAGVDRREFEDVSDERANRVCVLGEDDRVGAGDHAGRAS